MTNFNTPKKIPFGISDYEDIIRDNYFYIDKTKFIKEIENNNGKYVFFLRPRRFGKSLLISTLHNYYDINKKDKFETLFKDTYIGKNPTPLRNSYYILRFDFAEIGTTGSLSEIEDEFNKNIYATVRKFFGLYKDAFGGEEEFLKYFPNVNSSSLTVSTLFKLLETKNIKLYVLIDEYDNFANNILMDHGEGDYKKITETGGFIKEFFRSIKSGTNPAVIDRFFVTGVSQLVLSDITSGMNIGENISFDEMFNSMVGFNENEIEEILNFYITNNLVKESDKDEIKTIFKTYYNNYCFSNNFNERVCNSSMIFYFLNEYIKIKKIPLILVDSSFSTDYGKLKYMIFRNEKLSGGFDVLLELLTKGKIEGELKRSFSLEELAEPASFVSLLYYLGLVTVKEINVFNEYVFIIPNETVRTIEYDYVVKALNNVAKFDESFYVGITKDFKKMAVEGLWEDALNRLISMYYRSTSLRDSSQKELALKMFVFALLSLDNFHRAISETEQNRGYVDIYLKLKDKFKAVTKYEYLLEFKYIKANDAVTDEKINSLKNDAIEQLNRYEESEEIKEAKKEGKVIKKIVIIGSSQKLELIEEV